MTAAPLRNGRWTPMTIQSGAVSGILALQRMLAEQVARGESRATIEELRQRIAAAVEEKRPGRDSRSHDGAGGKDRNRADQFGVPNSLWPLPYQN